MNADLYYLTLGLTLGFTAGVAPGPLLTLVLSESLKTGFKGGFLVASAPLITDLPIIILATFILSSANVAIIKVIAVVGGAYLIWLGYRQFMIPAVPDVEVSSPKHSLTKGIIANLTNPHPYIFWISVGVPAVITSYGKAGLTAPFLFVVSFFLVLVLSKTVIAFVSAKSTRFLSSVFYLFILRLCGAALMVFGVILIFQRVQL